MVNLVFSLSDINILFLEDIEYPFCHIYDPLLCLPSCLLRSFCCNCGCPLSNLASNCSKVYNGQTEKGTNMKFNFVLFWFVVQIFSLCICYAMPLIHDPFSFSLTYLTYTDDKVAKPYTWWCMVVVVYCKQENYCKVYLSLFFCSV